MRCLCRRSPKRRAAVRARSESSHALPAPATGKINECPKRCLWGRRQRRAELRPCDDLRVGKFLWGSLQRTSFFIYIWLCHTSDFKCGGTASWPNDKAINRNCRARASELDGRGPRPTRDLPRRAFTDPCLVCVHIMHHLSLNERVVPHLLLDPAADTLFKFAISQVLMPVTSCGELVSRFKKLYQSVDYTKRCSHERWRNLKHPIWFLFERMFI